MTWKLMEVNDIEVCIQLNVFYSTILKRTRLIHETLEVDLI